MKASDEIVFDALPPERRRRSTVLFAHGCCCCCCLHTIGGIAGGILGSLRRNAPLPETLTTDAAVREEAEIKAASRRAVKVYWLALTVTGFLTVAATTILNPREMFLGPFFVALFLPLGQLFASIVAYACIKIRPPVRESVCLRRLGRITFFAFLGSAVGAIGLFITAVTGRFF